MCFVSVTWSCAQYVSPCLLFHRSSYLCIVLPDCSWEWRDELRMELEVLRAIEREGIAGAKLSCGERYCACAYQ